jgi:hypothetical protein
MPDMTVAFGGKADVDDRAALTALVVDDPISAIAGRFLCDAQRGIPTTIW